MDPKNELFEHQIDAIDEIDSPELSLSSSPTTKTPKLSKRQTKSAINAAVESGEVTPQQALQLMKSMGLTGSKHDNKKRITKAKAKSRRKMQKASRRANRS